MDYPPYLGHYYIISLIINPYIIYLNLILKLNRWVEKEYKSKTDNSLD